MNAVVRPCFAPLAVAFVAVGLAACGGGTTSPDTESQLTTSLPTQPFSNLAPFEVGFAEVTINGAGTLTSTADWTFATNDIDVYVTPPSCRAADVAELANCTIVGRTTAVTTKPEQLTVIVSRGNYRVWVANFGPSAESGTLRMTATVTQ
jgi:hypothetical protein